MPSESVQRLIQSRTEADPAGPEYRFKLCFSVSRSQSDAEHFTRFIWYQAGGLFVQKMAEQYRTPCFRTRGSF